MRRGCPLRTPSPPQCHESLEQTGASRLHRSGTQALALETISHTATSSAGLEMTPAVLLVAVLTRLDGCLVRLVAKPVQMSQAWLLPLGCWPDVAGGAPALRATCIRLHLLMSVSLSERPAAVVDRCVAELHYADVAAAQVASAVHGPWQALVAGSRTGPLRLPIHEDRLPAGPRCLLHGSIPSPGRRSAADRSACAAHTRRSGTGTGTVDL